MSVVYPTCKSKQEILDKQEDLDELLRDKAPMKGSAYQRYLENIQSVNGSNGQPQRVSLLSGGKYFCSPQQLFDAIPYRIKDIKDNVILTDTEIAYNINGIGAFVELDYRHANRTPTPEEIRRDERIVQQVYKKAFANTRFKMMIAYSHAKIKTKSNGEQIVAFGSHIRLVGIVTTTPYLIRCAETIELERQKLDPTSEFKNVVDTAAYKSDSATLKPLYSRKVILCKSIKEKIRNDKRNKMIKKEEDKKKEETKVIDEYTVQTGNKLTFSLADFQASLAGETKPKKVDTFDADFDSDSSLFREWQCSQLKSNKRLKSLKSIPSEYIHMKGHSDALFDEVLPRSHSVFDDFEELQDEAYYTDLARTTTTKELTMESCDDAFCFNGRHVEFSTYMYHHSLDYQTGEAIDDAKQQNLDMLKLLSDMAITVKQTHISKCTDESVIVKGGISCGRDDVLYVDELSRLKKKRKTKTMDDYIDVKTTKKSDVEELRVILQKVVNRISAYSAVHVTKFVFSKNNTIIIDYVGHNQKYCGIIKKDHSSNRSRLELCLSTYNVYYYCFNKLCTDNRKSNVATSLTLVERDIINKGISRKNKLYNIDGTSIDRMKNIKYSNSALDITPAKQQQQQQPTKQVDVTDINNWF